MDGCNEFGGRAEDGTPVARPDGDFVAPLTYWTLVLCKVPAGIMEQADRYRELLQGGGSYRVLDDRLEILGITGETRLVFARQKPLEGRPVELVGTAWKQVVGDGAIGEVQAATVAFVDDHLAVGMTACRGYTAYCRESDGRLGFPATSMTEYGASPPCAGESRSQEGQFTDDLSQAIEYAISEDEETSRLRVQTSRGGMSLSSDYVSAKCPGKMSVGELGERFPC